MRKLVYYVGVSLDGYIAGPNGEIDFMPLGEDFLDWMRADYPETLPAHARPHFGLEVDAPNRRFGSMIMGRATYEPGLAVGVASPYPHLTQYVVSTTLDSAPAPDVRVVRDPRALVRELKASDGPDIWLAGGGRLAATLRDEIDEMVVKHYPVVAGDGIPMFSGAFGPTRFTPVRRQGFANGTEVAVYRPA